MSNFTPGPWRITRLGAREYEINGRDGKEWGIASVNVSDALEALLSGYSTKDGYELLAHDVHAAVTLLRTALAKADGKAGA